MPAALLLLAAGGSARMGRAKQLLPYRGVTLLRHAASAAVASRCRPVVVVLGSQADEMRAELSGLPVRIVDNPAWADGMGTSIRAGLGALSSDGSIPAVVIMLCDQPAVTADVLNGVVERYEITGSPIIASFYAGIDGVPALFDRTLFDELMNLNNSPGARQLIHRHANVVTRFPFPEGAIDVDLPEDYKHL